MAPLRRQGLVAAGHRRAISPSRRRPAPREPDRRPRAPGRPSRDAWPRAPRLAPRPLQSIPPSASDRPSHSPAGGDWSRSAVDAPSPRRPGPRSTLSRARRGHGGWPPPARSSRTADGRRATHRSRGTRRALSPEREHGVALVEERHQPRQTPDARPRQQIVLSDSTESQAGPSELDVPASGEIGPPRPADVEQTRRSSGSFTNPETPSPWRRWSCGGPASSAAARELQHARCGLARVRAGGQDERQEGAASRHRAVRLRRAPAPAARTSRRPSAICSKSTSRMMSKARRIFGLAIR